jgi:hypothetical protein
MRKKLLFISIISALLGLHSCCTKKSCSGDVRVIKMINFDTSKLDSIKIETFQKNSTIRVDSVFTKIYGADSNYCFLSLLQDIDPNKDYKITIVSTQQVYLLSNFVTQQQTCNTCFPSHPANDYYTSLKDYSINGMEQYNGVLQITN